MNSKLQLIISSFTLFIFLNISSAGAAIFHDESIDGDLASPIPIIGTIMGDATFIGSLDGGTTSDLIDGPDESDVIIFRRKDIWSLDVDVIEIELVSLSLQSVSGGPPNSVIIRQATPTVYANMLPGEYRLDLFPVDHIGSLNYQFTIRTSASVPEPSALILVGLGLIVFFGWYRRIGNKQGT